MSSITHIPYDIVKKLIPYQELIKVIEESLITFSTKQTKIDQPLRTVVKIEDQQGMLGCMPCYSSPDEALACKLVTYFPNNKTVPTHQGIVLLFDCKNGSLLATVDGEAVTEMRTAAASAVASKHLANPQSQVLALIGSGTQAFSHFEALASVFKLNEIRVFSTSVKGPKKFLSKVTSQSEHYHSGINIVICGTVRDAVQSADIVCTVSGSGEPLVEADWLKDGCHVNGVGACKPHQRELFPSVTDQSFITVDSHVAAINESGDILINKATIDAELGAFVDEPKKFESIKNKKRISMFKSLGIGIEDTITAKLVWEKFQKN